MTNLINTEYSTETLLTQIEYDSLLAPGAPEKAVTQLLSLLAIVPDAQAQGLAMLAKIALKGFEFFSFGNPVTGVEEMCRAVLTDLKWHGSEIAELKKNLKAVLDWMSSPPGSRLVVQAARAAENAADPEKITRIARLLNNGALSWSSEDNEKAQLQLQQIAEFTRIAQILIDSDILVLRAIYRSQEPLIATYRNLISVTNQTDRSELQDKWNQAVWQIWKTSSLSDPEGEPIAFLDILSALPRLQSNGLICPTSSQIVQAEIASVPYGLTDLGAQFVEMVLLSKANVKVIV